MFTGLIQETGKVKLYKPYTEFVRIGIESFSLLAQAKPGDSIAVDGVCLTLTEKSENMFLFDVLRATLKNTTLKRLRIGMVVNMEPSLRVGDKLGGHFVLGHVDQELKLISVVRGAKTVLLKIMYPAAVRGYLIEKGSIAVNGISLTIQNLFSSYFTINVIPYTYQHTNLCYKKAGDWVNAEFDYLLKQNSRAWAKTRVF